MRERLWFFARFVSVVVVLTAAVYECPLWLALLAVCGWLNILHWLDTFVIEWRASDAQRPADPR